MAKKRSFRLLPFVQIAAVVLAIICAAGCGGSSGDSGDAKYAAAAVALISERTGISEDEARDIYDLLIGSGLDSDISHVTLWTDPATGERYYRVTSHGAYRFVYLSDDGIVKLISDGKTVYYAAAERSETAEETSEADSLIPESTTAETPETEPPETETPETKPSITEPALTESPVTEPPASESSVTESPETEPPKETPQSAAYVLNTNTKKFHYPSCRHVSQIKDKNRSDYEGSRDELIAQGYSPCGSCHP